MFVSNAHRRSVALGGRQSILPVVTEAPRKSIMRKSIAPLPPLNKPPTFDAQPTTSRVSAVGAVDVIAANSKRKSLTLECGSDQEMKSPPHFKRKFDEFEEQNAIGMSKFEIFHDDKGTAAKDDKDLFKTPSLPPARPRASSVYDLGDDNEGCTTQTFNFFIKSQSVSTPKAIDKPARMPSCDNQQRCNLFGENESPALTNTNADLEPMPTTTARQPFSTRMPLDEMPSPNYPSPEMELNRHKLSAILETTEDTNTMSSAATISSKSSSVSVDELRTIYEANSNIDSITSTTVAAANKSSPLATIDEIEIVEKASVAASETRLSNENEENTGRNDPSQPKCTKAEKAAALPFDIFEDNFAHYVAGVSVSKPINDEAPSMCTMNLIEEKTETIPLFLMNRNQTADASAMAPFAEPTLNFVFPPLDESTQLSAAPKTKTFDRSNFAIFEDDAVNLLCPVIVAVAEMEPNVNETVNKSVFNFGNEQSILKPSEPLNAFMMSMNDSKWSDSVSKSNLSARPTVPIDEIVDQIAPIHSVVDRSKFSIFQDETNKTMPHAIEDAPTDGLISAPIPIFTDQSICEMKNNTLQMSKNMKESTAASSQKIVIETVAAVAQPVISTTMTDIDEEYYRMIQSPDMRCSKQSMNNKTDVRAPVTNERSVSLVNSMKEISLTENKVDRNVAQLQPQSTNSLARFSFSEDCPNTELFSLHMASIKNSTLLERAPSPVPPTIVFSQSVAEPKTATALNAEYFASIESPMPTARSKSLNPPKQLAESRSQDKKCTTFDDEFYALINSPIPPMPPTSSQMISLSQSNDIYNISGIELNDTEMKLMRKDVGECGADLSFPKIQISEPKTIRPSAFNRMTAHFTIPDSPKESSYRFELENNTSDDQAKHSIEDRSVFIVEPTEDLAAVAKQCKQEQSSVDMSGASFRRANKSAYERKGSISIDYSQSQHIDPFDLNVQHAFLSDIDFVDYISKLDNVYMVNRARALQPDTEIAFGDKEFHIVEQIGRGSFGFVYRCVH